MRLRMISSNWCPDIPRTKFISLWIKSISQMRRVQFFYFHWRLHFVNSCLLICWWDSVDAAIAQCLESIDHFNHQVDNENSLTVETENVCLTSCTMDNNSLIELRYFHCLHNLQRFRWCCSSTWCKIQTLRYVDTPSEQHIQWYSHSKTSLNWLYSHSICRSCLHVRAVHGKSFIPLYLNRVWIFSNIENFPWLISCGEQIGNKSRQKSLCKTWKKIARSVMIVVECRNS